MKKLTLVLLTCLLTLIGCGSEETASTNNKDSMVKFISQDIADQSLEYHYFKVITGALESDQRDVFSRYTTGNLIMRSYNNARVGLHPDHLDYLWELMNVRIALENYMEHYYSTVNPEAFRILPSAYGFTDRQAKIKSLVAYKLALHNKKASSEGVEGFYGGKKLEITEDLINQYTQEELKENRMLSNKDLAFIYDNYGREFKAGLNNTPKRYESVKKVLSSYGQDQSSKIYTYVFYDLSKFYMENILEKNSDDYENVSRLLVSLEGDKSMVTDSHILTAF